MSSGSAAVSSVRTPYTTPWGSQAVQVVQRQVAREARALGVEGGATARGLGATPVRQTGVWSGAQRCCL